MGAQKNKKELQRLTLEQLIAARDRREKDMLRVEEIEIPSLGGTLLFKRPSDEIIFDMINVVKNDEDTKTIVDEMAKIIYKCCDQLHDQQLYEELDVGDPVDVVYAIMGSGDILDVGDKVCSMNSLFENVEEQIKNA